jgi:hypothetical protein
MDLMNPMPSDFGKLKPPMVNSTIGNLLQKEVVSIPNMIHREPDRQCTQERKGRNIITFQIDYLGNLNMLLEQLNSCISY